MRDLAFVLPGRFDDHCFGKHEARNGVSKNPLLGKFERKVVYCMSRESKEDFISRVAKSGALLPIGYKSFPENPTRSDWWAFIGGLSIPFLGFLAIATWRACSGDMGSAVGAAVAGVIFFLVFVAPKIILLVRIKKKGT
ncbi:hypothetical protein KGD83_16060 [Nocardiopsis akebiae]|uniref:Uncharacterized protein n=1 Tax=Nocardiopsis akebiae TaxID=2831968 RepID=A0ABX8BXH2_9ACTN|nr:hypothetical protein [Nocardiopsis akebiae]QUX26884.1 hypothetical protein KGD83_16060 [Nocardiopsis akebiae]